MPKFWITTHWPQLRDNEEPHHSNIYLQDGKEHVGRPIEPGDRVLIYESQSGPPRYVTGADGKRRLMRRKRGAQGIVTVADVETELYERDSPDAVQLSPGGKRRHWRWVAETTNEFSNGYVPRSEVLRVLGLSRKYTMKGFGEAHSGLAPLSRGQYEELSRLFKRNPVRPPIAPRGRRPKPGSWTEGCGGEGADHLLLKEYVAANPSLVLGEEGVRTHAVEFPFGTCDRADVVLTDHEGRVIGVEVEVEQRDGQYEGLLQAIKYRHMLAVLFHQRFDEARSVLVAYRLAPGIKRLCDEYDVKYFEVERRPVATWGGSRRSAGAARRRGNGDARRASH